MKVSVSEDSWYPVYTLNESFSLMDDTIEIPEAIHSRYVKIMNDFRDMQNEIRQFKIEQNDDEGYHDRPARIKVGKYRD